MKLVTAFMKAYWPILAILPVAALIGLGLQVVQRPWSAQEWGANVGLGFFITVAGVILAARQGRLQEALADLETIEKVAVLSGTIDKIEFDPSASRVCQMLNDGRAALSLIGLAQVERRREFIETLTAAILQVKRSLLDAGNLDVYCLWGSDDWARARSALVRLRDALAEQQRAFPGDLREQQLQLCDAVDELRYVIARPVLPFSTFEHFFRSPVGLVRVALDWALLAKLWEESPDGVEVEVRRGWDQLSDPVTFYAPWYRTASGRPCGYRRRDARPISFAEIATDAVVLGADHARVIDEIQHSWRAPDKKQLQTLPLATLKIDDRCVLVLDGNHRLSAALREPAAHRFIHVAEFRLTLAHLPDELLPDIATIRRCLTLGEGSGG